MYSILSIGIDNEILDMLSHSLSHYATCTIVTADDPDSGLSTHTEKRYDAIISYFSASGHKSLSLLKDLRSSGDITPFILVSGDIPDTNAADYYPLKDTGEDRLRGLAYVAVRAIRDSRLCEVVNRSMDEMNRIIYNLPDPTFAINTERIVIVWNERIHLIFEN